MQVKLTLKSSLHPARHISPNTYLKPCPCGAPPSPIASPALERGTIKFYSTANLSHHSALSTNHGDMLGVNASRKLLQCNRQRSPTIMYRISDMLVGFIHYVPHFGRYQSPVLPFENKYKSRDREGYFTGTTVNIIIKLNKVHNCFRHG